MPPETRTTAQIRAEILAERARLKTSVDELHASAVETGRLAGTAVAGLVGLVVVLKVIGRLRR